MRNLRPELERINSRRSSRFCEVVFVALAAPVVTAAAASVAPLTVAVAAATVLSASRLSAARDLPFFVILLREVTGLVPPPPQTLSFKCAGPSVSEAWIARPSRLVPNSDFQK